MLLRCPRRYASRTSFGRIPPRCHVNVMDIMSTSMENLCMVMPAAFCDVQHLLEDKAVLEMMSFAERMM